MQCVETILSVNETSDADFIFYRADVDTSSLAKANTDAAKMRCHDKREDEDSDIL